MPSELDSFGPGKPAAALHQPLVLLLAAFSAGMVVDRYWPLEPAFWIVAAISLLVLAGYAWLRC